MLKREDIRIRHPFILTDRERGCYYMYGTTALSRGTLRARNTFSVYRSEDLEHFSVPKVIFDGGEIGFWGTHDYWAPEVHLYRGKYYLFGSFKSDTHVRATQILVSDTPDGVFTPLSQSPTTPEDWECLDGTFFVEDGVPYMIFCHEWKQVGNGEICAIRLSEDLKKPLGEPFLLFRATDNPGVSCLTGKEGCFVTDGPFLWREDGLIRMIWSSFFEGRYLVLSAEADSLRGPWTHKDSLFPFDGGHAMIFHTLKGDRMISLHSPNKADLERPFFFEF
jgi:hypothetical protein